MSADRTEAKLRFAELSLQELLNHNGPPGDDFQRSHEENFLFHLHGAMDAFLHEINEHHHVGLAPDRVTIRNLERALSGRNRTSTQLLEMKSDPLGRVGEWRNSATHRSGPQRLFFVGGDEHGQRRFTEPGTATPSSQHIPDEFRMKLHKARELLTRLRADLAATPP